VVSFTDFGFLNIAMMEQTQIHMGMPNTSKRVGAKNSHANTSMNLLVQTILATGLARNERGNHCRGQNEN